MKITDQTGQLKARKDPVKNKNAKASTSSGVHTSLVRRSKNGKDKEASSSVSNGTSALDSRPRQPIKSRPFNDRQTQSSKVSSLVTFACFPKCMLKSSDNCACFVSSFIFLYFG